MTSNSTIKGLKYFFVPKSSELKLRTPTAAVVDANKFGSYENDRIDGMTPFKLS
jgi:hypothetical protein